MMKNLLLIILLSCTQLLSAQTVFDVVAGSADHTTLLAALEASNVDDALAGDGPFTLFAPTDAAFAALPDGVVDAVLAAGGETLDNLLLGHAFDVLITGADIEGGMASTTMTIAGTQVTFAATDDGVFINDAMITTANIGASNGTVHVIDMVLLPPAEPFDGSTVLEIIQNSDDHNTLETAIGATDLGAALSTEGPFTVFAPTDQAFEVLGSALDDILADDALLNSILSYHVVEGSVGSGDLVNGPLTTLEGSDATIAIFGESIFIDEAKITLSDLAADNGVVHVIDVVLTPPPAFTVLNIINDSEDHTILAAALAASGLDAALAADGPYTVFAPTDAAFEALPDGTVDALLEDPTGDLVDILYTHVLGGVLLSGDLGDGQQGTAFSGETLTVTVDGDNIFVNGAQVTAADLEADNGVLHVVDSVILPTEDMVGIEDLPSSALALYPVPAQGSLNISIDNNAATWELSVFNILGQEVKATRVDASTVIDVSDLASGTYVMQLLSDQQRVTKTFMVK